MAAGGYTDKPTSFLSKLGKLLSGRNSIVGNNSMQHVIVPGNSPQSTPNVGLSNTITTSQPVSQQGQSPNTADTISQSNQVGLGGMSITPGINTGSQSITIGGNQTIRNTQTGNQLPTDSLQATNQNLLRRAFSAALEDILTQDVVQEQKKFSSPMVRDFKTQNEDKIRQELQASELARLRRNQTSDYQSNQLMGLGYAAQSDKLMSDINKQIQQDVVQQQDKRFEDIKDIRNFNAEVENYKADIKNKERMAKALKKQERYGKWGKIATDALFGDPLDEAQNQKSIQEYLEAETQIKSGLELKAKLQEMINKQKQIDDKYTKLIAELKVKYQNETDPEKKLKLQTQYETELLNYEKEREALNKEFERFKEEELPLQKLEMSKLNQIRANRFTNPTGIGLTTRKFLKGGKLSPSDIISIEREKSRLKAEQKKQEAELKKQDSLLLERVKQELKQSMKNKEKYSNLRFKLIESLIDSAK